MTQRIWAGLVALVLVAGGFVAILTEGLPFVTFAPGLTVNVLGDHDGKPVIQVSGHQTYRDDGQLRLTTVYLTRPDTRVNMLQLLGAYLSRDDAIEPFAAVYAPKTTNESDKQQGEQQMASAQDSATAAAMRALGYDVPMLPGVAKVYPKTPATGVLETGDVIRKVGSTSVSSLDSLRKALQSVPEGDPVTLTIQREGDERQVRLTPETVKGQQRIGVAVVPSFDFPFQVTVDIDPSIGGPSAGLMFSLGIYDTLTPGSLTHGATIAGTGTLDPTGKVGPIGGIDQKIAASREAGAQLFLVPKDNCADVGDARPGDEMRLVKVTTMSDALGSVRKWAGDHDVQLPTCTTKVAS